MVTSSVSGYAHYKIITIKRINKQINKLVRCVDKQFQKYLPQDGAWEVVLQEIHISVHALS